MLIKKPLEITFQGFESITFRHSYKLFSIRK
jgi:hypothetical protein